MKKSVKKQIGFTPLKKAANFNRWSLLSNGVKERNSLTGFTLLEIIVVISIFLMLAIMSSDYIIQGFRTTAFGYEQDEAVQNGRKVINSLIKEIREAAQSDRGDYLLDAVEEQNFSFYSNIDSDNNTEKVRYFLDNGVLKRGVIEPAGDPLDYLPADETVSEIAQYINNQAEPMFAYYDTNYNLIANPSANKHDIRLVKVFLKINVTPERAPNDYIIQMDIQIRNLKDNL
jgi:prepilin-type N-terminal cleavage/methylation domain-containing protein